jgi:ATP-binding cassette, subfamily B, multidrug efflux pump
LGRLIRYFKPYWPVLLLTAALIIGNTWTQVVTPQLTGDAVDCYLTPATVTTAGGRASGGGQQLLENVASSGAANCSLNVPALGLTPLPQGSTTADYIAGLGRLVLLLIVLYAIGAIAGALQFYFMSWAGQQVIRKMREEVFAHIHKLSLNYYAEREAGQVMSRVTNDMPTRSQQAFSFALVQRDERHLLLIGWIAIRHAQRSACPTRWSAWPWCP